MNTGGLVVGLRRGQAFDAGLFVLSTAVSLAVALPWLRHPSAPGVPQVVVALTVVALAQFPLVLQTAAGEVVIGFEAAALVFLSLVMPAASAVAMWYAVMVVAHAVVQRRRWHIRLFNIGCTSLSGVLLVVIVTSGPRSGSWRVGVIAVACAVYFFVDLLLTSASLAVDERVSMLSTLPVRNAPLPLTVFVGINTLGYLAALLYRAYSHWALLLLVVPLVTILVAARAVTRARDSGRRTAALFAIARSAAQVEGPLDVVGLLAQELEGLLPTRVVGMRTTPPGENEIGAVLPGLGLADHWMVVSPGTGAPRIRDVERETLETLVAVAAETLDRQRLVAEMTRMARYDPLTGLANRALFTERLTHAVERARRGQGGIAVLYCDLDGFKRINDRHGHDAGDRVIQAVADRLRETLRSADTAARLGGDEFAVLAENVHDAHEAVQVAERIRVALERPLTAAGQQVRLGLSIGVAMSDPESAPESLVRSADMAMYRAKAFGKNRVELFDPEMRRQSEHRLTLEDELRSALDRGGLSLAFQPVIDLADGRVDGFEALLRWSHPSLGHITPDVMLPVAEQLGLMPRLGRWVLREAHRQGVMLSATAGRPLTMAVNVAAEQLHDEQFLRDVERLAPDARVNLVLELTERALVDEAAAATTLDRLHDAGASIAIDDFGVGYSSIGYLHRFGCIDVVKMDRSFVSNVANDDRTRALVDSVVAMARAFDAVVVAEGIEDWRCCSVVRAAGCQLGQGFLFSRPVTPSAAAELLAMPSYDVSRLDTVVPVRSRVAGS